MQQPSGSKSRSQEVSSCNDSADSCEISFFNQAVLKYINDMLMEEDLADKPCMLHDCLRLQAAEKSFYDVLGENYPPSSHQPTSYIQQNDESPEDYFSQTSSVDSCNSYPSADSLAEPNWNFDQGEFLYAQNSEKGGRAFSLNQPRVRKNQQHEDNGYLEEEERSKKHSAVISTAESKQLEIFDNSFLHKVENNESLPCPLYDALRNEESKKLLYGEQLQASKTRTRRKAKDKEMVDLSMFLIRCAQATASGDQRTAGEQLKLIRLHSSPYGDANQRLAHYLANALDARLAGTSELMHTPFTGPSSNAADVLKAYQLYVSVCPFRTMSNFFANRTITKSVDKATRLHIIDFGISYGFQWPCFIYRLSTRPGPPKLRITGIDHPQSGFRPAERVEETGRRLKRVADRMKVPFEYNAIAQKWETIRLEDLKIEKDEVVAVCCMYRLDYLPDDTVVVNSPRDAVLRLIKSINPEIFLHGILNGSYNAPFFTTRFREALFHFSSLFDMFEAIASREDKERLVFERELIGKDIMNVVACEGLERFSRPETYKRWQSRNSRIGFRQLPLHQDIMRRLRNIKNDYHKDFSVNEDGNWMLVGWKGRIINSISAWKSVE